MKVMQTAGVTLKLANCTFSDTAFFYLDRTLGSGQLEINSWKSVSLEQVTASINQTEFLSFLGMYNAIRGLPRALQKLGPC